MSHKQSIVFPTELYTRLSKAAEASGLAFNRYVIQRLNAKNDVVFIGLQELTQALVQLQQIINNSTTHYLDEDVRLEVNQLCRYCGFFLVQMIKNRS